MSIEALYIILTGAMVAGSTALLGSFLILRKMAMFGDAISHAVLPGIVLAYFIAGERDSFLLLLGAAASGLIATFLIDLLHKKVQLQEDASIGISFTWLFAIGVILISAWSGQVDLDQECVLYGEIAYVPLDLIYWGDLAFPRPLLISTILFLLVLAYVVFGFKGLKIISFNWDYAKAMGLSTGLWHLGFMSMVSITTVLSFEIVGAILIVALLVVPAASAYLWTEKLKTMLFLAVGFGTVSSLGGYFIAATLNASIAGSMVGLSGLLFLISLARYRVANNRQN